MEVIAYDFCRWISTIKITNIKVKLCKTTEIDFKPAVSLKPKSTPGKVESQK